MKKVSAKNIALLTVASMFFLSTSCNNPPSEQSQQDAEVLLSDSLRIDSLSKEKKELIDFKFFTSLANLPSPFEVVNDLSKYKAPFKAELLNPASNTEKYLLSYKKEINFGVLGVDLAYINFYNQNQKTVQYFLAVQSLAKDLNIESVFNQYAERYQSNSDNQDSLVSIVDNIFNETDAYLRENDRYLVASHIMAGAIIEVNFISINLLKEIPKTAENAVLYEKIYNENLGIFHLINLYEEYTDKDSKELLVNMKSYKKEYDSIIKSPDDLTPANIDKAIVLITKLRSGLVN
ncbi:MAG: hypothetical protein IPN36_03955 [Bacteroidetes bacterium]|jgi:hypothetical protein|nr:hypothetical protein [Bacteroidota bacterium]MBP6532073.1 hypothetical protein [Bacteroidia bacterium]